MAFPREPDDAYRSAQNEMPPRPSRFDDELQRDLEMSEGPAGSGRMATYSIAALLIVGAVLYGIAHTSTTDTASTTPPPPASNTAANTPAPLPPPARDVTPRPNTEPGTTTGAAPSATPKAPVDGATK
ncbi:hypothetical protein [Bradyrhizobium prioriisuperbiae]|uniref:hypothetical protein n=1 Tax=Bradyrhizobium prioriisuperbiae TaxID=2854389 RepID=UPI0028E21807|nr:hypothetical protein [Bradyrhizobium prioritasuperba]